MSGEMIAIVAVGVALAGVILTATRGLRQDMARLESRLDARLTSATSHEYSKLGQPHHVDGGQLEHPPGHEQRKRRPDLPRPSFQ